MHVRIISFDTFRRVYCAEKKPIGSKRWLKTWRNWNLQAHNIASLYNASLFAKLQFYLIELFTSEKCRNRRQLRSSDSKEPKTRILNKAIKRQTWIKLRFAVFSSYSFMRPVPAALLDTRKAVTQFIQRPLAPTGQKKSVAVLRCSRGFYEINSDRVPHLGNNLHRVQKYYRGRRVQKKEQSGTLRRPSLSLPRWTIRRSAVPSFSLAT